MRSKWSVGFNLVMVLLFAHGAVDQFTASPHTTYRIIAGAMMVVGFAATSATAWRDFRQHRPKM